MLVTIFLLILGIILTFIFRRNRLEAMSVFKEMGIPGPPPHFLFGNMLEFRTTPLFKKYQEWKALYGDTFGYFEGPTPVLVTSDVNILQEVFIKQFNIFHARKLWPVQVDPDKDEDVHMFFARGRRWKRLRAVVNPAFSTAKMKKMAPTVNECINNLMDVIKDESRATSNRTIELLDLFRRLTLDTILRCEIGLQQNSVKNRQDPFLQNCKGVIEDTTKMPWLYFCGFLFPDLHCLWIAIYKFWHNIKFNPVFWLEERMREVIVLRKDLEQSSKKRPNDLMQHMLSAQLPVDTFQDIEQSLGSSRAMTNEEIVSHSLLFLLAGYETTSTTLGYIFYELSQNPSVQQRLRHEIQTVLARGTNSIEFSDLKDFTYLDYVIWETLRKYPLASTVTARQAMQDCTIGELRLPEGMLVHANLWDVQYDPRHWGADPQAFNPLRFVPEKRKQRHPMAWMPFGAGPRSCAGLRFAMLQLKMVVAKLLRDFDIHPSEKAGQGLSLHQGATILPANGVHLTVRRRASAISTSSRRGSSISSESVPAWVNQRRVSVDRESYASEDSDVSIEEAADLSRYLLKRNSLRRGSLASAGTRRNSMFDVDDNVDEEFSVDRRDSLSLGIELLKKNSINKAVNLLRKVSLSEGMDSGLASDKTEDSDTESSSSTADTAPPRPVPRVVVTPPDTSDWTSGLCSMPDDLLGALPYPKTRRNSRRCSARQILTSVSEIGETPQEVPQEMNKESGIRRFSFCPTQTVQLSQDIYKRRKSG